MGVGAAEEEGGWELRSEGDPKLEKLKGIG